MGRGGSLLSHSKERENQKTRAERQLPHGVGPACPPGTPFPEPGLVRGAVRLPSPRGNWVGAKLCELQGKLLLVTLMALPMGQAQSLSEQEAFAQLCPGGQTLIAFAVPNPNPDNDLAAPQMWAGKQGVGSASLGPLLVLRVFQRSLSSPREAPQSQDPTGACPAVAAWKPSGTLLLHHCPPRQGHEKGAREWLDIGVGGPGTHRGGGRWAKCPEVLGWAERVPWADRSGLVTGCVFTAHRKFQ